MATAPTTAPTARIEMRDGAPQLMLHGRPVAPQIFFFNTEMPQGQHYLERQVALAARAGIHIYSMVLPWPWFEEGVEPEFGEGERIFQRFLDVDPEAYFIPRVHNDAAHLMPTLARERPEECIRYADGSIAEMESMASEWWLGKLEQGLRRTFRHYEASPYADRIIGYCYGSEWFHHGFWDKGWDFNPQNRAKFQRWLKAKYEQPEALERAWCVAGLSFATAEIPPVPCNDAGYAQGPQAPPVPVRLLHDLPTEQAHLDFYAYSSEIVVDTLIRLSALIKEATEDRRLSIQFYGYDFEVMGSNAGHASMMKALQAPEIDVFVSPTSYDNRTGGGISAFMSAIDSVPLHGKLWLVENDMRTDVLDLSAMTTGQAAEERKRQTHSRAETLHCITRDFAAMQTHRCGTWWMDLIAGGAYSDPAVWERIAQLKAWYGEGEIAAWPYRPEVGVVIDEASLRSLRYARHGDQPNGLFYNEAFSAAIYYGRHAMYRLGASVGYYYMEDFLSGKMPRCKVYWFPASVSMTDDEVAAVHARLNAEGAMAIWQFAPAYLGPEGADVVRASRLTGMQLERRDGRLGSIGNRRLRGLSWGEPRVVNPRLIVLDDENTTETLGRYAEDGAVSAGWRYTGAHCSVFFGDLALRPEVLRPLLAEAGVHVWTQDDLVVHTDGAFLLVQATRAGVYSILLPAGRAATALGRETLRRVGDTLFVEFEAGESLCFKIAA